MTAGLQHPEYILSGITQYPDIGVVSDKDAQIFETRPQMAMTGQVRHFKYITLWMAGVGQSV